MSDLKMALAPHVQREAISKATFKAARGARRRILWRLGRRTDQLLVESYLRRAPIKKLHIGCGLNVLAGWLNADYFPRTPEILHLDATEPFSLLETDCFDYVFSEHMIEHIAYADGAQMLTECHRVLKPGGTIRITTPDLSFLVDLYKRDKSEVQQRYINWASERGGHDAADTFVINNFVRSWGHQFIYDEKTLRTSLERAGFTNVTPHPLQYSDAAALRSLENESRMPPGFLQLESFTLQARKVGAKVT